MDNKQYTHVAIPKDTMSHLWAYLEQRPFKEVGHFMTAPGIQTVVLNPQPPILVQEKTPELEGETPQ
jgi:hypothetical protein